MGDIGADKEAAMEMAYAALEKLRRVYPDHQLLEYDTKPAEEFYTKFWYGSPGCSKPWEQVDGVIVDAICFANWAREMEQACEAVPAG